MSELHRLRRDVEEALRAAADPGVVLPLLHRLAKLAAEDSEASAFAHRSLAEILVDRDPWRAALYARRATRAQPSDDRGWAALGLCQTLLGNYRAAAAAYLRAVECAPSNPWYAHNLGHLLDVALGRAKEAVGWLQRAYKGARRDGEIATSYAQALGRSGAIEDAKRVLKRAMKASKGAGTKEQLALMKWLEDGAERGEAARARASKVQLRDGSDEARGIAAVARNQKRRRMSDDARERALAELRELLDRGLGRLPLSVLQRERALAIASEAIAARVPDGDAQMRVLAAAIAYAVIYDESVPLTATEVAATFRVSAASLRGRFASLRTRLSIADR